jgi:hypothetical protein
MSPCICTDDSHPFFKVITGAYHWNPTIEKTIKKGDLVYFERSETGVNISLTNNKNLSVMFITESDFVKHFEDTSLRRDNNINKLLS